MAKKKKKDKKKKAQKQFTTGDNTLTKACTYLIWAGLLLSLLVPLMVSMSSFFPFISYRSFWFMGTVQFTFAAWLFLAYHNPAYRPNLNLVSIAMVLFIVAISISTVVGADMASSFWSKHERMTGLLMHLHLFAYFLVLASFLKNTSQLKILLSGSVAVSVIVSLWGVAATHNLEFIIEFFDLFGIVSERLVPGSQGGSTLGQTSFLNSYLLINAYFAVYLLAKSAGRLRIAYAVALLPIILGIYLNPRGDAVKVTFLFGFAILALLYLAFCHRRRLVRLAAQAVFGLGLLAAPVIGILTFVEGSIVRNLVLRQSGLPGRIANWESALEALKERPLFGWGLENFEIALYKFYDPRVMLPFEYGYRAEPWHDRAHNVVIDYLIATGIIGTIFFFAIFACAVFVLWQTYMKQEEKDFWLPGILTTLLAAHIIQNLTVFDMLSSYMLIFLVLAIAAFRADRLLQKAPSETEEKPALQQPDSKAVPVTATSYGLVAVLIAFVIVSFTYFVYKPYQGGYYTNRALQENYQGSLVELYPQAIYTSPLGRQHIRRHLAEVATKRLRGADARALTEIHFPEVEYMIKELTLATEESPLNFRFYYSLGQTCNAYVAFLVTARGEEDLQERAEELTLKGEEAFRDGLTISPTNINAYLALAQNLIYQGAIFADPDYYRDSLELVLKARDIEPRLYNTHLIAVCVATAMLRDQDLALELIEEAVAVEAAWEEPLLEEVE